MNSSIIASTIVLIATGVFISLFSDGPWQWVGQVLGFAFVLAPILWYWFRLARKQSREEGLSDTEIDSVYYLGFLITIITLAFTILYIGLDGSLLKHTNKIISQFGCGLLATGLALFARLHLLSNEETKKRLDVAQKTEQLAWKLVQLTGQFDSLSKKIGDLAANGASLINTFEFAETEFHNRLAVAGDLFEQATQRAKARLEQADNELNAAIERSLARERALDKATQDSLDKTASAIDLSIRQFADGIGRLVAETTRLRQEAETISFKDSVKHLETSLNSITDAVNSSSRETLKAVEKLVPIAWEAQAMASEIASNINTLKSLDTMVAQVGSAAESLEKILSAGTQSGDALVTLADKSQAATQEINGTLTATLALLESVAANDTRQELRGSLNKTTLELQTLTQKIQDITQLLSQTKIQLDPALASIVQASTALGARKTTPPF